MLRIEIAGHTDARESRRRSLKLSQERADSVRTYLLRRIPSLDSDMDYKQKTAPNVRDLDAEIADELEAALKDVDAQSLYNADDSNRARAQAEASGMDEWLDAYERALRELVPGARAA